MKKSFLLLFFLIPLYVLSQPLTDLHHAYRDTVLGYSHDLKSAAYIAAIASEEHHAALSEFFPKVTMAADASYLGRRGVSSGQFTESHLTYGAMISLRQPLYMGGGVYNAKIRSQHEIMLTENQQQLARNNICYMADKTYWTTVAKKEIVSLAEDYQNTLKHFLLIIQQRIDEDPSYHNDLLMSQVKLNEADYLLLKAVKGAESHRKVLLALAGVDESDSLRVDTAVVPLFEAEILVRQIDSVIASRPEIKIARNQIDISRYQAKVDNARYIPHIYLGIDGIYEGWGRELNTPAHTASNPTPNYAVFVRLSYNLTESGKGYRQRRIGRLNVSLAQENLSKASDLARVEIETASYNFTQAVEQVRLTHNSLEKAEQNEQMTLQKYAEGRASVAEVLDAQTFRQQARLNYIESKLDAQIARSNYLRICNIYHL